MPSKQCAYCGHPGVPVTKDHVVPRALWGGKGHLPAFMKTVWQCDPCKAKYDAEVTYFRNRILGMIDRGRHPIADRVLAEQVIRSFTPSEQNLQSEKNLQDFFQDFRWVERRNNNGEPAGLDAIATLDLNRFNLTIEKIVRGLFFVESGRALPAGYYVLVVGDDIAESSDFIQDTLKQMGPAKDFGDDVFHGQFVRWAGDNNVTAWQFQFYGAWRTLAFTNRDRV